MSKIDVNKIDNPVKYYFIADPSYWPLVATLGAFCTVLGLVQVLHGGGVGPILMAVGIGLLLFTMAGWFGAVIKESLGGLHSEQMHRSYVYGMLWFIFSEIFLFGVFFGALFYVRVFGLTELSGTVGELGKALLLSKGDWAHKLLWPNFQYAWPLLKNPNPQLFPGPSEVVETFGIPLLNTAILLSSAVTITWSHWGLKKNNRNVMLVGLALTILLGCVFEGFQAHEYIKAYTEYGLTLGSGIYGSTFFTLTGLHAMHVSMGVIMLSVIFVRCWKNHFTPKHHFAYQAVSWYWHFVDVVWIILFFFVYWL